MPDQADPVTVCAGERLTAEPYRKDDAADVPDAPPESFWLSKDAEIEWFNRNAYFERKDSSKGSTAPNSNHSVNSQQRLSVTVPSNFISKASIIGFPMTPKHSFSMDQKNRRNCRGGGNICLFPDKLTASIEPSSPKVSCMGRVRSKKDSQVPAGREPCLGDMDTRKKSRFLSSFQVLIRFGCRGNQTVSVLAPMPELPAKKSSAELMARHVRGRSEDSIQRRKSSDDRGGGQPGLARMMRFASGRRSDSLWPNGETKPEP